MKATINKSNLMKRAWAIYRSSNTDYNYCFSASLRRAFEVEKQNVEFQNRKAQELADWKRTEAVQTNSKNEYSASYTAGLINYYNAGSHGRRYFGD